VLERGNLTPEGFNLLCEPIERLGHFPNGLHLLLLVLGVVE
jgi:hypothetical protein